MLIVLVLGGGEGERGGLWVDVEEVREGVLDRYGVFFDCMMFICLS